MPLLHSTRDSVLIVDPDKSIRQMIAVLLRRAGFRAVCATEFTAEFLDQQFDVIVRDVNLAPSGLNAELRELEETPAELLARTVIMTTGPAASLRQLTSVQPFAVIGKPFDVAVLLDAVRECRDHHARAREASARDSHDDDASATIDTARVERFVRSVPHLRALLHGEAESQRELLVRNAMRRTARELSHVLARAATEELDGDRAAVLLGAAVAADKLTRDVPAARRHPADGGH